jgi:prephenate dehydrogenase
MFAGRPWLFTPTAGHNAAAVEKLTTFAAALGASPRTLSPEDHDHLLAFISHLPQLTVSALMHVVGRAAGPDGLSLSGRGLQDTTRLASSPAGIWKEVCATNADEIGLALEAFIAVLQQLGGDLKTGKSIDEVFESANLWRETLLSKRSGPDA